MHKLKTIEPRIGFEFKANGHQYVVEDKLSIMRAVESFKLELELFELNTTTIKNQLILAYNDLNGNNPEKTVKFADASIKIHNLVNKIQSNLNFKELPILKYCALFINRKDEDRREITKELIEEKITDWQEEGYELNGFFLLALTAIPHVKKDFLKYTEDILKTRKQESAESNISTSKK